MRCLMTMRRLRVCEPEPCAIAIATVLSTGCGEGEVCVRESAERRSCGARVALLLPAAMHSASDPLCATVGWLALAHDRPGDGASAQLGDDASDALAICIGGAARVVEGVQAQSL